MTYSLDLSVIELRDLLLTELNEWYGRQPFEILQKIFGLDYLFDLSEEELDEELDVLRNDWYEMPIDEKLAIYELLN